VPRIQFPKGNRAPGAAESAVWGPGFVQRPAIPPRSWRAGPSLRCCPRRDSGL